MISLQRSCKELISLHDITRNVFLWKILQELHILLRFSQVIHVLVRYFKEGIKLRGSCKLLATIAFCLNQGSSRVFQSKKYLFQSENLRE